MSTADLEVLKQDYHLLLGGLRESDPRQNAINSPLHAATRQRVEHLERQIEQHPQERAAREVDDVRHALSTWERYVAYQVSPRLRAEWARPTPPRLAHRLGVSEARVLAALKRAGITLPDPPDPFADWQ